MQLSNDKQFWARKLFTIALRKSFCTQAILEYQQESNC